MKVIIGGAYQGKLDYAQENYGIADADVYNCESTEIDFSKKCIYHLEKFSLACVRAGLEPKTILLDNLDKLTDTVLICEDISCGVVPIDPVLREWREATGRMLNSLTPKADSVVRMFCGLAQVLK